MTSGISCSILDQCLVRQRILLRPVFGTYASYSAQCWFDGGYFFRQSTRRSRRLMSTRKLGVFLGDDFRIVSVFIAEFGSTADTCTASVYEAFWKRVFLWEMTSGLSPYSALSLVRQRIHALRQSTRLSGFLVFLWEMTSGLSPCSALCLVRQRIHALRQSTRLSGASFFSGR